MGLSCFLWTRKDRRMALCGIFQTQSLHCWELSVGMCPFIGAPDWLDSEKRHLKADSSLWVYSCSRECALEASIQHRMSSLIAFSFISSETGFLTEPGACRFCYTDCTFPALESQACAAVSACTWGMGIWTQVLMLVWPMKPFPQPQSRQLVLSLIYIFRITWGQLKILMPKLHFMGLVRW